MNDDRPTITQQYSFTVGENDDINGKIEPSEESVETSLETFGADVDHRERDTRIDQPEATSFGVDDRPEVASSDSGKQGALFAQADEDQRTLGGERAASQCLFESDGSDESTTDGTDDGRRTEPAARASEKATITRAVADGGRREDTDDAI